MVEKRKFMLGIATAFLISAPAFAQSDEQMVASLMKLRADVEALHTQIEDDKDAYRSSMKSLSLQKNDFEAQINRQETQLKKIDQEIAQIREMIKKRSAQTEGLTPMILAAADQLSIAVKDGIPFKTDLRLNDIKEIKEALQNDMMTPEQALAKIWGSYDDMIRMSSENGMFKQAITIGGEPKLAQVVKLGTVMLFFKLPTGEVGYAKKEADGYVYVQEHDEARQKQIATLFDAMNKQIRTGSFTLPYALFEQGGLK